jgi:flagellar biogenesis protein FliO
MEWDWTRILQALFFVAMIAFVAPRAMRMVKNSPEGNAAQWMSALVPLGAVIAFVVLLIYLV